MKRVRHIIADLDVIRFMGDPEVLISGVTSDSRRVEQGSLFAAIKGTVADGHDFIRMAFEKGAAAVILERIPEGLDSLGTYILVRDAATAYGACCSAYHGHPSRQLKLVGITGTNGKTTTATLCYKLFRQLGYASGLISTIENKVNDTIIPSTHTTPGPDQLHLLLRQMVDAGCSHAFMEVSSHAVHQKRIAGLQFNGAVFTNITHDHLDYHKTFDNYIAAKKLFFDNLSADAFALVNRDDKHAGVMVQNTKATIHDYALKVPAEFKGKVLDNGLEGLHLNLNGTEIHSRLNGLFNASNLLAVYGVAILLGEDKEEVSMAISSVGEVRGRFDVVKLPGKKVTGIVDYAHTPDAVEKVLASIREMLPPGKRIITVIGCGGDRDRAKRPVMARSAASLSDQLVLTSDNPRTEDPNEIIREMESGLDESQQKDTITIPDRRSAIRTAVKLAGEGDVVLVAGKGHETYQEVQGVRHHFNDREELLETLTHNNI